MKSKVKKTKAALRRIPLAFTIAVAGALRPQSHADQMNSSLFSPGSSSPSESVVNGLMVVVLAGGVALVLSQIERSRKRKVSALGGRPNERLDDGSQISDVDNLRASSHMGHEPVGIGSTQYFGGTGGVSPTELHEDVLEQLLTGAAATFGGARDGRATKKNEAIIRRFVKKTFVARATEDVLGYVEDSGPSLSALREVVQGVGSSRREITYAKLLAVAGEGNFVLATSEGMIRNKPTRFYDLFRLEKGQIVQHWNRRETRRA